MFVLSHFFFSQIPCYSFAIWYNNCIAPMKLTVDLLLCQKIGKRLKKESFFATVNKPENTWSMEVDKFRYGMGNYQRCHYCHRKLNYIIRFYVILYIYIYIYTVYIYIYIYIYIYVVNSLPPLRFLVFVCHLCAKSVHYLINRLDFACTKI